MARARLPIAFRLRAVDAALPCPEPLRRRLDTRAAGMTDRAETATMRSDAMPNAVRGESPRYPMPAYPRGWYCVCDSGELAPGEIKPLRVLGQELVAARTNDGRASVFDAPRNMDTLQLEST